MGAPSRKSLAARGELYTTDYEGPASKAASTNSGTTFVTASNTQPDSASTYSTSPSTPSDQTGSQDDHYRYESGKLSSKSSLGKVYFKLKNPPPSFLLVDIDVYTMEKVQVPNKQKKMVEKDQRKMVASKRFRSQALLEYLEILEGEQEQEGKQGQPSRSTILDRNLVAFDLEARAFQPRNIFGRDVGQLTHDSSRLGRTTRLLMPVEGYAAAEQLFSKFHSRDLVKTKMQYSKAEKLESPPNTADKSISCSVIANGKFITPILGTESEKSEKEDLYPRYLQIFLQHQFSTGSSILSESITGSRDTLSRVSHDKEQPLNGKYDVRLKHRIFGSQGLCVECDIVPVALGGTEVTDYAKSFLPESSSSTLDTISILKKQLQGARVQYRFSETMQKRYPIVAKEQGWAPVQNSQSSEDESKDPRDEASQDSSNLDDPWNRAYTVRDVKTNSAVGQVIEKKCTDGTTKYYTVKTYLGLYGASIGAVLENLPLADIGGRKPFWVPVSLLKFHGDQVPPNTGHITKIAKDLQMLRSNIIPKRLASTVSELLKAQLQVITVRQKCCRDIANSI